MEINGENIKENFVNIKKKYEDSNKTEAEQNWKFAYLILGLSLGMLAFSMQTTTVTVESKFYLQLAQYISYYYLILAFFAGFCRIFHLHKIYSKGNVYYANKYYKEDIDKGGRNPIERGSKFTKFAAEEWFGSFAYSTMILSFILGILFYVIFKIISYIYTLYIQYC